MTDLSPAAHADPCNLPTAETRVGVVIPVFNRRTILLETLPYLTAQTLAPALVVIVDDGSSDGTAESAEDWLAAAQPKFAWRILRCGHTTAATARCVGLEIVKSLPWLAFLDSDDHWPPDFLARAVAALRQHPWAVAASADRQYFRAASAVAAIEDMRAMAADPLPWFFNKGAGVASCTVLRTEAALRVGGWQPELDAAEDAAFFAGIAREGSWLHLPGAPVAFHLGSAPLRSEENNLTHRYDDRNLRWARVFELIYEEAVRHSPRLNTRPLRRALARRWCAAAKQLQGLGRLEEARRAVARAVFWQPTCFRAWRWQLQLALSRAAGG